MLTKESTRLVIKEIMKLYPNADTALNYDNDFQLLIAVMLSAQTTDLAVNKVTPTLFATYPNPEALAQAKIEDVQEHLKTIGLYKNKAKYAIGIGKRLLVDFDSQVPDTRKDLMSLPGVGRKTANVILSVAFNQAAFPVDTHITRVSKHHKIAEADWNVRQIEDRIVECLDPEDLHHAHLAMILFGREICHPRNPKCANYPQLYVGMEDD